MGWSKNLDVLLLDLRMKELADLGVGSKPFLDIAGVDTITDRSVNLNSE